MRRITMLLAAGLVLLTAAALPTFRAIAQQKIVTDDNLNEMIQNAKTPADHEAIATYYDNEAAENEKKAHLHRLSANMYTKPINAGHCNALVNALQDAADQDKALAANHREMAEKAKSTTRE